MSPRIPPLPRPEWSASMRDYVTGFRGSVRGAGPEEGRQAGDNLLGTLAQYPNLAIAFLTFNRHLLSESTLTLRQRELLVLRVAHIRRSGYEWAQHAVLADHAGITPAEIERVATNPAAPEWSELERGLLTAVDQLLDEGTIDEDTWDLLTQHFDEHGLMDVVFTVGCYAMLAMSLRSFDIEPEPGLVPHLPRRLAR